MNDELDRLLDESTAGRRLPGVAAGVYNSSGTLYEGAFGVRDMSDSAPMELETVFSIMSMTKPIAGVACLQAVEKGPLDLDQPGGEVVPWLADVEVLDGFADDGTPQLRPATTPVTLRNLLTHTSGFVYEIWNANQARYLETSGRPGLSAGTRDAYRQPLAFDPGSKWEYGIGIDWATTMLETATGRTLEELMRTEVFDPLGMNNTAYVPSAAMAARLGPIHTRDEGGRFQASAASPLGNDREYNGGGGGLHSTLGDYSRFLRMILRGGELDGSRVLERATVSLAGENHMGDHRVTMLPSVVPAASADAEFFPESG